MVFLTLSLAGAGLAASTLLFTASSRIEPADAGPDAIVCVNLVDGHQRTLPEGERCAPRTEIEVPPIP